MPICEWCGNDFDLVEAENEFESGTYLLSYDNLDKCLCGSCAIEAIEEMADGVYFETCQRCSTRFDLIEEESRFSSMLALSAGTSLRDYWKGDVLCADCAIQEANAD